jgi:type I restriction enzyme S subunit
MFGNTLRRSRLRDMGVDFVSGKNVVGVDTDAHPVNRVIKVSAISGGVFVPSESKPMPREYAPPAAHRLRRGDILFGRASGSLELLGATAVVDVDPEDLFLPDKVWRLATSPGGPVDDNFVLGVLRSTEAREYIRHRASGAAGVRNIGKAKLLEYAAPLPPLDLQREFASRVGLINQQRSVAQRAFTAEDGLFASLQSRAFRGEL